MTTLPGFNLEAMMPTAEAPIDEGLYNMLIAEQEAAATMQAHILGEGWDPTMSNPPPPPPEDLTDLGGSEVMDQSLSEEEQVTQALMEQRLLESSRNAQFQQRNEQSNKQDRVVHTRGYLE